MKFRHTLVKSDNFGQILLIWCKLVFFLKNFCLFVNFADSKIYIPCQKIYTQLYLQPYLQCLKS